MDEETKTLSEKVLNGVGFGLSVLLADLGSNSGLFDALAAGGQQTAEELAKRTGLVERYVLDWLANQVAVGFVSLVRPVEERPRFYLSDAQKRVFVNPENQTCHLVFTGLMTAGAHNILNRLPRDFKEGKGIPFGENHPTAFTLSDIDRKTFPLEGTMRPIIASLPPSLKDRFTPSGQASSSGGPMVVLDVACGRGSLMRYFAKHFPGHLYVGLDNHEPSLETARQRTIEEDLSPLNPLFHKADAHTLTLLSRVPMIREAWNTVCASAAAPLPEKVDLVFMQEALHDLADPLAALVAVRALLADKGALYVVEPGHKDFRLETLAGPLDACLAAASISLCGPGGMAGRPDGLPCSSAHLGTIAPDAAYFDLAKKAGFGNVSKAAERVYRFMI